ncbi:hypothetical protein B6S44_18380 [Bosea sp. Tri-44]|nr:hypothetical protein B6S44_18380 [Bosea sp. Tri-44]
MLFRDARSKFEAADTDTVTDERRNELKKPRVRIWIPARAERQLLFPEDERIDLIGKGCHAASISP